MPKKLKERGAEQINFLAKTRPFKNKTIEELILITIKNTVETQIIAYEWQKRS